MKGVKIVWTKEMDAILGSAPDPEVAKILGLCSDAIYRRRKDLGINAHGHKCKLDKFPGVRCKLGKVPDTEIAKAMEITRAGVAYYRRVRDINACETEKPGNEILGTMSDAKAAKILGISESAAYKRRVKLGIPASGVGSAIIDTPGARALVGKVKDSVIAQMTGLDVSTVKCFRRRRGIPAFCQRAEK